MLYLKKHNLDILGIVESNLHGSESRIHRKQPLSTSDIHQKLQIHGYSLLLPESWHNHDQARIIGFVKDGLQVKEIKLSKEDSDLPSLSIELGL